MTTEVRWRVSIGRLINQIAVIAIAAFAGMLSVAVYCRFAGLNGGFKQTAEATALWCIGGTVIGWSILKIVLKLTIPRSR